MAWVSMLVRRKREEGRGIPVMTCSTLFAPSSFSRLLSSFGSGRHKQSCDIHHQQARYKSSHLIAEGRPFPEHELQQFVDHLEDGACADGEKQRGQDG